MPQIDHDYGVGYIHWLYFNPFCVWYDLIGILNESHINEHELLPASNKQALFSMQPHH